MFDNYHEVEDIVSSRVVIEKGALKKQYLTKWKNYGQHRNSWEPVEHFAGSTKIQEFESFRSKLIALALTPRKAGDNLSFLSFILLLSRIIPLKSKNIRKPLISIVLRLLHIFIFKTHMNVATVRSKLKHFLIN